MRLDDQKLIAKVTRAVNQSRPRSVYIALTGVPFFPTLLHRPAIPCWACSRGKRWGAGDEFPAFPPHGGRKGEIAVTVKISLGKSVINVQITMPFGRYISSTLFCGKKREELDNSAHQIFHLYWLNHSIWTCSPSK